jgi:prepilin-type N-terminal cleavage/methylation domain-containing protein
MRSHRTSRRSGLSLRREDGFTLIELLVTMTLITIGIFATATTFSQTRKATDSGERLEAMAHRAQNEMEQILSLSYSQIGMSAADMTTMTASGSGNPWDPANFINTGPPKTFVTDWKTPAQTPTENFVTNLSDTTCTCDKVAYQAPPQAGDRWNLTVWRFVTWINDPCTNCPSTQDYKRITIAVTSPYSANVPTHAPYVVSTIKRP